ncbi:MAG TPA: hypothetical protein VND64_24105 [Pirellulales bacterium]|nr:hypothetical protein [Pirellulales bacterium]
MDCSEATVTTEVPSTTHMGELAVAETTYNRVRRQNGDSIMAFWQIASGDGTVDLETVFLKLSVALLGPGGLGDYFDHRAEYLALNDGHLVRAFCEDVEVGDALILKRMVNPHTAEWDIKGVGMVVGAYRYEPIFERVDVSRWDMQHCRRVNWIVPKRAIRVTGGGAPVRIQRCADDNILVAKARELLGQQ